MCWLTGIKIKATVTKYIYVAIAAALTAATPRPQSRDEVMRRIEQLDRSTVRLPPAAFPELPKNIVGELERRGCTIPQVRDIGKRHNVIRGEFQRPGRTDWAVLCSVEQVSSILVFWNGSDANPAEIARMRDRELLMYVSIPNGVRPGWVRRGARFARYIRPVGAAIITDPHPDSAVTPPSEVDHQGIDDVRLNCVSSIHYWYKGKWLVLPGGD